MKKQGTSNNTGGLTKIWAPWRVAYISQKKPKGCIFCKAYRSKNDRKNFVIYRSQNCFALLNIFPYNNGHIMVAPKRHIKSLEKLHNDEILDIMLTVNTITSAIQKLLHPEGFNIGMNIGKVAGAGIDSHLHIHIVPRWRGDTNFMPVISNTKVISQSLDELFSQIKKVI